MTYHSISSERTKTYVIHPYRLAYAQGGLYLLAFVPEYGEVRTFAVERIQELSLLEERFTPIEELPRRSVSPLARRALGSAGADRNRVSATDGRLRSRTRVACIAADSRRREGGAVMVTLDVCMDRALQSWILSFGPFARVTATGEAGARHCGAIRTSEGCLWVELEARRLSPGGWSQQWSALVLALVFALAPAAATTKAIKAGRLIAPDGKVVTNAVIVIENDRVVSVGPDAAASGRRGDRPQPIHRRPRHDRRAYAYDVLTGIVRPGRGRSASRGGRPASRRCSRQKTRGCTLETGVTTVRDLGAANEVDYAMRDLINMGKMVGPRMFVAGQGLSAGRGNAAAESGPLSPAGRSAYRLGVRLGEGLRLARQLPERRHDADADVRGDESGRGRRAREEPSSGDSFVRTVGREGCGAGGRRFGRARHRSRR